MPRTPRQLRRFAPLLGLVLALSGAARSEELPAEETPAAPVPDFTPEEAIATALGRNRELRALRAEIDRARGERRAAQALPNPELEIERPADRETTLALRLEWDAGEALRVPGRSAEAELPVRSAELDVEAAEIRLAAEARSAFAALAFRRARRELLREVVEAFAADRDLAEALASSGAIPPGEAIPAQLAHDEAESRLARAELEVGDATEALALLLGETAAHVELRTLAPIATDAVPVPADVESAAVAASFELATARLDLELLARRSTNLDRTRALPEIALFSEAERRSPDVAEASRRWSLGGGVRLRLPLLDRRNAERAALDAERRAAEERIAALEASLRSGVRTSLAALRFAESDLARIETRLLPAAERFLEATLLQLNAMQVGLSELLRVRRRLSELGLRRLDRLEEATAARAELDALRYGVVPNRNLRRTSTEAPSDEPGGHDDE